MRVPRRLKWKHVKRFYEQLEPFLKASPIKLERPDSGRILVLSPHIDDDVIGCGGTLAQHVRAGDKILILYFADCSEERIKEAKAAAAVIGFERFEFFEYGSKTLFDQKDLDERISKVINTYDPDIVYIPVLMDRHNDHIAINHSFCRLSEKNGYDHIVYAYEVWTPCVPNLLIDITSSINIKKDALTCYKSQLEANNWLDAAISLNRYRAITSGTGIYAEGFMRYSAREYSRLWKRIFA